MPHHLDHTRLRLSVAFGTLNSAVSRLLVIQHDEEPQTPIALIEMSSSEQLQGIDAGDYDLGLSLTPAQSPTSSLALHRDELAVTLPVRSPLLALENISLRDLAGYPLIMWAHDECAPLGERIASMLQSEGAEMEVAHQVKSLGLLVSLVSAGYGIAFAGKSQITAARHLGVIMRPLSGLPHPLTTYLLHREPFPDPRVERFVDRARRVAIAPAQEV